MTATTKKFDIKDRTMCFAIRVAKFVDQLPRQQSTIEYTKQLIRASASVGANLEEADGALSRKDFLNKIGISRREAKESSYWLKLIYGTVSANNSGVEQELEWLLKESEELKLILSSIINKTRSKG